MLQDGALLRTQPLPPLNASALASHTAAAELNAGVPCKYYAAAGFCAMVLQHKWRWGWGGEREGGRDYKDIPE